MLFVHFYIEVFCTEFDRAIWLCFSQRLRIVFITPGWHLLTLLFCLSLSLPNLFSEFALRHIPICHDQYFLFQFQSVILFANTNRLYNNCNDLEKCIMFSSGKNRQLSFYFRTNSHTF